MDIGGFHLPTMMGAIAAGGAAFTAVYGIFSRFDDIQSQENRTYVSRWLFGLQVPKKGSEHFFVDLFNKLFGPKHWSFRCALTSIILTIFFLIFAFFVNPSGTTSSHETHYNPLASVSWRHWAMGACVVDYLSLWKTRLILTKISTLHNVLASAFFVLFDAIITTVLFSFLPFLLMFLLVSSHFGIINTITYALWDHLAETVGIQIGMTIGYLFTIYYFVALLTSAWLWAYVFASQAVRLLAYVPRFVLFLSKVVAINEHPVRVLGFVAGLLSACIMALINVL